MKNNTNTTSFEKYKINPPLRYTENRILNTNIANNNLSFEISNKYFKKAEPEPTYSTIIPESSKSDKNFKNKDFIHTNDEHFYQNDKKNYYYKDYYEMETYQPGNYQLYEDYSSHSNWNIRPFTLNSQSIDYKANNINKRNFQNTFDRKRYPSNHTYYESKYSKKKKIELKNNNILINKYKYNDNNGNKNISKNNFKYSKEKINISKESLSKNKRHIPTKNQNNRYESNSPSIKNGNESLFSKIPKERINNLINISKENSRKNILKKNNNITISINNQTFTNYNNNTYINTTIQPKTPLLSSYVKINSPTKKLETESNNHELKNDIKYNKSVRNLPYNSLEKITFKKLVLTHPNNNYLKYNQKLNISEENIIISEPLRLNAEKKNNTPKQLKVTKIYANLNKNKNNNNITININNKKENKNEIKNIQLKTVSKPGDQKEHTKSHTEIVKQKENNIKKEKKLITIKKKKINNIQEIKIINKNKNILTPRNNIIINVSKNKNSISDKNIKKTNINAGFNTSKNSNINLNTKLINNDDENNYLREIENIMYNNNTEPSMSNIQIQYNFKENKNLINYENNQNKSKIHYTQINNKEIKNKYSHIPMTDIKKNNKSENISLSNNKKNEQNQIVRAIPNIYSFDHYIKEKNSEILNTKIISIKDNNKDLIKENNKDTNKSNNKDNNKDINKDINKVNHKDNNNGNTKDINKFNNKDINNNKDISNINKVNNKDNNKENNINFNKLNNKDNNKNINNIIKVNDKDNNKDNLYNINNVNNKDINKDNNKNNIKDINKVNSKDIKDINNNINKINNNKDTIYNNNIANNKSYNKDNNKDINKVNNKDNKEDINKDINKNNNNKDINKEINKNDNHNNSKTNISLKNIEDKNLNKPKEETKINLKATQNNTLNIIKINEPKKNPSFNDIPKLSVSINIKTKEIKNKPHRPHSELPKRESRFNDSNKDKKKGKNGEDWDHNEFKGMRKQTYDSGRRGGKKNKNDKKEKKDDKLKDNFSLYIKATEAITIAGKNEYGKKKTNQDTFIMEKNVNGVLNFNIFGVLDGHGENGHFASQFVSRYVIHRIKNHPLIKKLDEPKEIYNSLISNGYEIIANAYLDADVQILKEKFDCSRSGTTIVLVIQLEEHIICANTGDSRAIAIFDDNFEDNLMDSKIYPLSYDCKPELPNEEKRINEYGGVVEKAYYSDDEDDEYIPFRVWAKGEDFPGLAMSRSIGDTDAKKVGVIPNPQIVEYTIDYFSKYILIASDGIWEFITNEDAMEIGNKFYLRNDPVGLCQELTQKSIKLWQKREAVIDDITLIVIFF